MDVPPEIAAEPELAKYWAQRYRLFSRFDEGVKLDHGQSKLCLLTHCTFTINVLMFILYSITSCVFGISATWGTGADATGSF